MKRFSFEEIFGNGSYQNNDYLVIAKAGLVDSDSPEVVLMALLNRCLVNGQITVNSNTLTINGEPLEYNNLSLYEKFGVLFTRNQLRPGYFVQILKVKLFLLSDTLNLSEL